MKTTIQKRYAIKVGTAHLSASIVRLTKVSNSAMPAGSAEIEQIQVVQTWTNKSAAQTIADHIRNDFKPEDGDIVVVEFPLLVRK